MTRTGDDFYAGNARRSQNWPTLAPGDRGVLNSMTPDHFDASGIVDLDPKPPITWIRGTEDQVVSDQALFDLATLGALGAVPGWPGEDVIPSQPMEGQMRAVLAAYAARGGATREVVLDGVAHGIPLEASARVAEEIRAALVH
jgi:hypothetical protein